MTEQASTWDAVVAMLTRDLQASIDAVRADIDDITYRTARIDARIAARNGAAT